MQKKGAHRPFQQYHNPNLWLLDATSASATAVHVGLDERQCFNLDPRRHTRPSMEQSRHKPWHKSYSRLLHRRYASLCHHSGFPTHLLGSSNREQSSWGEQRSSAGLAIHGEQRCQRIPRRPVSAIAERSLERVMTLQKRRQNSAHR
jgi:hypothetical protein